jgi:hypothetical protein
VAEIGYHISSVYAQPQDQPHKRHVDKAGQIE